jgi:hypothetical protein
MWLRTRDAAFLAELIKVDMKNKADQKQIRSLKFDVPW